MENDTMILLLITISLFVLVIYNQFIRCDKEDFKNNLKMLISNFK